ncbi:hypothetical protein WH47_11929 [Habropoda laboriosa]|uniref:Uncharacterized protein n=1 Tax=Habropoda laboriosa TaxID=597456 RepID=A0A0L7R7M1_9HYME|nr:hypothetical protein WH47_11929 [Habropoda laboriosa]
MQIVLGSLHVGAFSSGRRLLSRSSGEFSLRMQVVRVFDRRTSLCWANGRLLRPLEVSLGSQVVLRLLRYSSVAFRRRWRLWTLRELTFRLEIVGMLDGSPSFSWSNGRFLRSLEVSLGFQVVFVSNDLAALSTSRSVVVASSDVHELSLHPQIILSANHVHSLDLGDRSVVVSRSTNVDVAFHLQVVSVDHYLRPLALRWLVVVLRPAGELSFGLQIVLRLLLDWSVGAFRREVVLRSSHEFSFEVEIILVTYGRSPLSWSNRRLLRPLELSFGT